MTAARTPRASASAASGSGTPTSSTCSRRARSREIAALLDEYGLRHLELEFLMDWFLDPSDERRHEADRIARAALGGRAPCCPCTTSRSATSPGRACELRPADRALRRALRRRRRAPRREGRLRVHAVRRQRPRPRHGARGSSRARTRRTAASRSTPGTSAKLGIDAGRRSSRIPPRHLGWVELSDGPYENMPDLVDEVINHRELPGEGEFPIREYVAALPRRRLRRPVGRRGALAGAAQPADRADLRPRVRDEQRAALSRFIGRAPSGAPA